MQASLSLRSHHGTRLRQLKLRSHHDHRGDDNHRTSNKNRAELGKYLAAVEGG